MIKRKSLITLLAVMCFATLLSAVGANMFMASANASWKDGASSFAMVEGASPRCDGENTGIRFISSMDESEYLALESKQSDTVTVNYGMIILPYDYVGTKGALTEENLFGANAVYCFNEKTACIAEDCQKTHITRVQSETMHQDSAYAGKYILNGSLIKILDNNNHRIHDLEQFHKPN